MAETVHGGILKWMDRLWSSGDMKKAALEVYPVCYEPGPDLSVTLLFLIVP